jgi:hypothetical protein
MIIVDVLALATIIGACAIGTLLAKNKYQPVMEGMWENRRRDEEKRYKPR